jgi:hypothetical protein
MKIYRSIPILAVLCACIFHASYATAMEESRSVSASVSGGGRGVGINAERVPGRFTVPEGHIATGFKYHFSDPNINYTSTRLSGSNIYSETQSRYISEVEGNPNAKLPPGKYKFVVGGRPGASGTLSFTIVSTTVDPPEDRRPGNNLGLPRNFDVTFSHETDIYVTDKSGRKQWKDTPGVEIYDPPDQIVAHFRNGQLSAQWKIGWSQENSSCETTVTLDGMLSLGKSRPGKCRCPICRKRMDIIITPLF